MLVLVLCTCSRKIRGESGISDDPTHRRIAEDLCVVTVGEINSIKVNVVLVG